MSKFEPTFALRKKNATDTIGRVCAFINYTLKKGESKMYYFTMKDLTTGKPFKVPVSVWDKKNNRCFIKGSVAEKEYYQSINSQIKEIEVAVKQIVEECDAKHCSVSSAILSEENIYKKIKHIETFTESPEPKKNNLLVKYWERFIERAKKGEVNHKGKLYKKTAITNYQKCLNGFKVFEKSKKHHYTFDEIDKGFYDTYVAYMVKNNKLPNTIGERIKNLKALMQRAYEEGLHSNLAFQSFTKPEQEVDNVYLTEAELEVLYGYQFTDANEMLDKYRDLFLVGCYTGLRWEDYKSIRTDDFTTSPKGNPVLVIRTSKTGTRVVIPFIWKHLEDILEKYAYSLPKVSEQKFNQNIKVACLNAGINAAVVITSGKKAREEPYEKWELVSSHTARRTACTNMFLRGIPTIAIMKISGHKKESTFMKYIKVSAEENADYIAENYAEKDTTPATQTAPEGQENAK